MRSHPAARGLSVALPRGRVANRRFSRNAYGTAKRAGEARRLEQQGAELHLRRLRKERNTKQSEHHVFFAVLLNDREAIQRTPPVFVISLVHVSSVPSSFAVQTILEAMLAPSPPYHLQSFICYRGYHYVSICKEGEHWIEYSDGTAFHFADHEDMIANCIQWKCLPVLLFFSQVPGDCRAQTVETGGLHRHGLPRGKPG